MSPAHDRYPAISVIRRKKNVYEISTNLENRDSQNLNKF
jgi:hypothetical protein